MPQRFKTNPPATSRPTWREYQIGLKKASNKERLGKRSLKFSALCLILFVLFYGLIVVIGEESFFQTQAHHFVSSDNKRNDSRVDHAKIFDKRDLKTLIDSNNFTNLERRRFDVVSGALNFRIDTSIDIALQSVLLKEMKQSIARSTGIVCMDPETGKILSMVGFDKSDASNNPCIDNRFPAASIFKIVTASAAIEECGFNLDSKLKFNGKRHTLYKSQLKERTNRYTRHITFQDAFAQSINPVFGKIGSLYLGKAVLEKYAAAFGFNRAIDFEIQFDPSPFTISDESYQWAEIASGFNRETKISPLHGALIASVIINQGKLIEPTIIDQIIDEKKQIIYRSNLVTINQAIAPETSKAVGRLMETTIKSGTFKKSFKGYQHDKILSKLNIGGKSGSIANRSHDARYDWFVGFAEERGGKEKIALAVLVIHGKYIGKRAGYYARTAMKQYFRNYFASK